MEESAPKITVVHATAPGCHWSWGYEAVVNRLKMVYGDQIDLVIRIGCPYESWDQWLVDYGMSEKEACEWMDTEIADSMGVPLAKVSGRPPPPNMMPASLSTLAALRQGPEKGWRYQRALLRMYAVEGKDPSAEPTMQAAAKEAKLDLARFEKDWKDQEGLAAAYAQQERAGPPLHVGFYNFAVWDGGNRRVILDYAFDPRQIEGAIEYLSEGKLSKRSVGDITTYLKHHGLAPLSEVGRVFDFASGHEATAALEKLEKAGKVERITLAGAPHWRATA